MTTKPAYPGIRVTTDGNHLVSSLTEVRYTEGGVFDPITASTQMGEDYQLAYSQGKLNVFGQPQIAIETEGEHAAQGGAIAYSVTGRRSVNFTSGQGIAYGIEHYMLSRQMVLFCVERRKARRLLQSRAGIDNRDYQAHRALIKQVDDGEISITDLRQHGRDLMHTTLKELRASKA